jgi:hypothetical protein
LDKIENQGVSKKLQGLDDNKYAKTEKLSSNNTENKE